MLHLAGLLAVQDGVGHSPAPSLQERIQDARGESHLPVPDRAIILT